MSSRNILSSKKFMIINLLILGITIGIALSFAFISIINFKQQDNSVYALDDKNHQMEDLEQLQSSFRKISADVMQSVVQVNVVAQVDYSDSNTIPYGPFFFPDDDTGRNFFENEGLGSGVIVKKEGRNVYVLTNHHVIAYSSKISIMLHNNDEYDAVLVGSDDRTDLALVKFQTASDSIKVAVLGDSDKLLVGDWVLAIGNPFGYFSTVTAGIVSAKGRSGPDSNINEFIQTDAAINQGNSGGALVNIKGEVVGINTWILTPTGINIGLGFSIPINNAVKAIEDFISFGEVEYGWLGVSHIDIIDDYKKELKLEKIKGVFIPSVYINSPAYKGGIRPGDFLTSVNGYKIEDYDDLARNVGNLRPNEAAEFTLYRNSKKIKLSVKIGKRSDFKNLNEIFRWPGFLVLPLNDEIKIDLELEDDQSGVLIQKIKSKTSFKIAGIRRGDIIIKINNVKIKTLLQLYTELLKNNEKDLTVTILRESKEKTVKVKFP